MTKVDIKQMKKEVKKQKQGNNNMKRTVILTVVTTLIVLGALAATFIAGINYEKGINQRIHAEAKALTSNVSVKEAQPSK